MQAKTLYSTVRFVTARVKPFRRHLGANYADIDLASKDP
jgi:hypothetical protein